MAGQLVNKGQTLQSENYGTFVLDFQKFGKTVACNTLYTTICQQSLQFKWK